MTQVEIDNLANEIYKEIPNGKIKQHINQCLNEGKATREEVKDCVLFKIAEDFRRNAGI